MKYAFVAKWSRRHGVALPCRLVGVSRSGYYKWLGRGPSGRVSRDQLLLPQICRVHEQSRGAYGALKTWIELNQRGIRCGKHTVARLRAQNGIEAKRKARFRRMRRHRQNAPAAPNLLDRCFKAEAPNRVWVGDITTVTTGAGWLHLAVVLDLYAKRVVGWAMGSSLSEALPLAALDMAIVHRRPAPGLVHHTDQGSQYRSRAYRDRLLAKDFVASNSRKGDCYDNAVAESFFSNLKNELTHHYRFKTREEARTAIFDYIEVFYNRRRIHQSLGYRTPEEVELGA